MASEQEVIRQQKQEMRRLMKERAVRASPADNEAESEKIRQHLRHGLFHNRFTMLAAFHPRTDEPDIRPFLLEWLAEGGRLCLPVTGMDKDGYPQLVFREVCNLAWNLHQAPLGLLEPDAALPVVHYRDIQVVLVPGVAFDRKGRRLGRGKGYYDRFLAGKNRNRRSCFPVQEPDILPDFGSLPDDGRFFQGISIAPVLSWQFVEEVPVNPDDVQLEYLVDLNGMLPVCRHSPNESLDL